MTSGETVVARYDALKREAVERALRRPGRPPSA